MQEKYIINGVEYDNFEDLPEEFRTLLKNGTGKPTADLFTNDNIDTGGVENVAHETHRVIYEIDGQSYNSIGEIPEAYRDIFQEGQQSQKASGAECPEYKAELIGAQRSIRFNETYAVHKTRSLTVKEKNYLNKLAKKLNLKKKYSFLIYSFGVVMLLAIIIFAAVEMISQSVLFWTVTALLSILSGIGIKLLSRHFSNEIINQVQDRVLQFEGAFATKTERLYGTEGSVDVSYIDGHRVSLPDHWPNAYNDGDYVRAEGYCFVPFVVKSTSWIYLLSCNDRSINDEIVD